MQKDVGRLWKNILFPGIFVEYADTKEALKTVKVETKTKAITRNDIATIQKQLNTGINLLGLLLIISVSLVTFFLFRNQKTFYVVDSTATVIPFITYIIIDGKYNVVDASTAPKIVDMTRVQEKILKPVKKPVSVIYNFIFLDFF